MGGLHMHMTRGSVPCLTLGLWVGRPAVWGMAPEPEPTGQAGVLSVSSSTGTSTKQGTCSPSACSCC